MAKMVARSTVSSGSSGGCNRSVQWISGTAQSALLEAVEEARLDGLGPTEVGPGLVPFSWLLACTGKELQASQADKFWKKQRRDLFTYTHRCLEVADMVAHLL